jgi:hypothetical protein
LTTSLRRTRSAARRLGRPAPGRAAAVVVALLAIVALVVVVAVGSPPAAAQSSGDPTDTSAPDAAATDAGNESPTTAPTSSTSSTLTGSTTTSTTLAPARCDTLPPIAAVFVGTVTAIGPDSAKFHVDEKRTGDVVGDVQVLYVRDARFIKDGSRYLVTASVDAETKLLVSKVRPKRGEDPRCSEKDPIYTRNVDGKAIDSGIFAGLHGRSRDVAFAFLKPLGVVLAGLAGLVIVKYVLVFSWRGIRHLFRRRAPT